MQGESQAATTADFNDVFARESHESGAESVAPDAGQPRDDQGRFAQKPPEAQPVEPSQALTEHPALPERQQEVDPKRVPLTELKNERTKRQEAERRALEREAEANAYRQMVERLQQQQPAPQQQQAPQIDPYTDPEGYRQMILREAEVRRRHDIANFSESVARRQFGTEIVDKAQQWALQTGVAQNFFMRSADPYGELIDAYKRVQAMQEIGTDPAAYEKKVREKVLAELKAGGTQPAQRFPGSLASATAAGAQGQHLNPEAAFAEIFDPGRDRRKW